MPIPLLLGLPLLNWAAGSVAATGAIAAFSALDRQQIEDNTDGTSNTDADGPATSATRTVRSHTLPDIFSDPASNFASFEHRTSPRPRTQSQSQTQAPRTITPAHTPAIRALELALLSFVTVLQTSSHTSRNDDAQQHPLNRVLIWSRRIAQRIGDIPVGRDADTVAHSIQDRIEELLRRVGTASGAFETDEWKALRRLCEAVDEVGRVLGRRVSGTAGKVMWPAVIEVEEDEGAGIPETKESADLALVIDQGAQKHIPPRVVIESDAIQVYDSGGDDGEDGGVSI